MTYGTLSGRYTRTPEDTWHRWVSFVGGVAGALLFAIPSTLSLPLLWVLGRRDEPVLFPEIGQSAQDLWIGAGFSLLGLLVLGAIVLVGRAQLDLLRPGVRSVGRRSRTP